MAILLDCLCDALEPFTPCADDLLHLERLLGKIDDWLNPKRLLAKVAASRFGLRSGEFALFDKWWELSDPAMDMAQRPSLDTSRALDAEVRAAFTRLAAIVNDRASYTQPGYRHIRRMSGDGRFVIFSDHHMAFAGSRHDFFRDSGNSALYSQLLKQYADAGFTLIENGDVEELIIHEPLMPPPYAQLELQEQVKDKKDLEASEWDALDELRTSGRRVQLAQVIATYRELYDQINEQFVDTGRYIRLAGNHDQDNQDESFLELLRTVYPKLEQVYDFLIIEPAQGQDSPFVVGHGHHFDKATTPKYSRRIGETLSECLGWAYEGADRVWRWGNQDGVEEWADGEQPFFNTLVTDDPDPYAPFRAIVEADLKEWLDSRVGGEALLQRHLTVLGGVAGMAASLADELSNPAFWEFIYHHNIAWEHFRSDNPGEAIFNEVMCGKRWNKFRHLDEVFINEQLERVFESKAPYLVLGHSHEPRHRAVNPAGPDGTSSVADRYLNSGAAGRFGNLIWCVEISDGVPQVVAWHRPGGKDSGLDPERRTYTPDIAKPVGLLVASDRHVPLPSVEEAQASWLEAVLHVMMS